MQIGENASQFLVLSKKKSNLEKIPKKYIIFKGQLYIAMTALNSQYEKCRSTSKYGRLSKWLNYAKESRGIKQKEVRVVSAQCSLLFIAGLLESVGRVSPPPHYALTRVLRGHFLGIKMLQ